jgi:hypothetical protein
LLVLLLVLIVAASFCSTPPCIITGLFSVVPFKKGEKRKGEKEGKGGKKREEEEQETLLPQSHQHHQICYYYCLHHHCECCSYCYCYLLDLVGRVTQLTHQVGSSYKCPRYLAPLRRLWGELGKGVCITQKTSTKDAALSQLDFQ